jgi:predicted transcriptional regulator
MTPRRSGGRPPVRLQDTVRLSAGGIAKVLGDLEARVMNVAWALDHPASAREVHEIVLREHDVALPTVITVLNKLTDKRLLQRSKIRDLYHYSPRLSREEFLAVTSRRLVEGILALAPDAVAASLVDVLAEHEPEKLAALGRLVRKRLREQGE